MVQQSRVRPAQQATRRALNASSNAPAAKARRCGASSRWQTAGADPSGQTSGRGFRKNGDRLNGDGLHRIRQQPFAGRCQQPLEEIAHRADRVAKRQTASALKKSPFFRSPRSFCNQLVVDAELSPVSKTVAQTALDKTVNFLAQRALACAAALSVDSTFR